MALAIHAQMVCDPTGTDLPLFTCPYEEFVVSRLWASTAGASCAFTLYIVPDGDDGPAAKHMLYDARSIPANDALVTPAGITLSRGDQIWVKASATLRVTLFGEGIGVEG